MLQFQDAAGQGLGSITSNPSANTTAYGTSSDYRLKENIVDINEKWRKVSLHIISKCQSLILQITTN